MGNPTSEPEGVFNGRGRIQLSEESAMTRRKRIRGWLLAVVLLVGSGLAVLPATAQQTEPEKPKPAPAEKKTKKKKTPGREPARNDDTRRALSRVLRNFTDGLEGLSPSSLRDWVFEDQFYDFPRFEEGVTVLLRSAGEMRLYTREVNTQIERDRAVMIVDAEMVFASRDDPGRGVHRQERITFDFQRTADGWKITEINPRSFFLP